MTKRQAKAQLAQLAAKLAVRNSVKRSAQMGVDESAFDKACADVQETEAEIWELEHFLHFGTDVSCTRELVSNNID